jgi:hypothetical protein
MTSFPDWPRKLYRHGGGDAFVLYTVFGKAPKEFALSKAYRTSGIPEGVEIYLQTRREAPDSFSIAAEGPIGAELSKQQALATAVRAQNDCVLLRGEIKDPPLLNYLRDTVGLITWLLDQGCVGVLDTQIFRWWSPAEWRKTFFDHGQAYPRHHAVILVSPEDDGTEWFHTRGMRKFGRPDISVRFVPAQYRAAVTDLCNRFIEMQAFGATIREGQEINMATLPPGMKAHHWGSPDDLAFNNVHVEIAWPDKDRLGPPE